jgi:hypothetical protein
MIFAMIISFVMLWWGGPKVPADSNLALHWVPGVWFLNLYVAGDSVVVVISDPRGHEAACHFPCEDEKAGACTNTIADADFFAFGTTEREGSRIPGFLSLSTWRPQRGVYRITVKGRGSSRVSVMAGAQYSRQPHWKQDTLTVAAGEEYAWLVRWGKVLEGDSSRVALRRCQRPDCSGEDL